MSLIYEIISLILTVLGAPFLMALPKLIDSQKAPKRAPLPTFPHFAPPAEPRDGSGGLSKQTPATPPAKGSFSIPGLLVQPLRPREGTPAKGIGSAESVFTLSQSLGKGAVLMPKLSSPAAPAPPLPHSPTSTGRTVLYFYATAVLVFAVLVGLRYRNEILDNTDTMIFASGLFIAMIGGMFVQVLTHNYRTGNSLFEVTASQLLFPVLFGLIVFYPIWSLAASSPRNLFPVYAAFLNGYFWENVVSSARRQTKEEPNPVASQP